jgi:hypothetical protein
VRLLLVAGAILPHAPLLLEAVSGPLIVERAARFLGPLAKLELPDVQALVIASPHGPSPGVYAGRRGDLAGFGCPDVAAEATAAPDLAGEITRTWRTDSLGSALDHGIVVPLCLDLMPDVPVVAAVVPDAAQGKALADALLQIAQRRGTRIGVVASAHTSVALTERAPLGYREEAVELEKRFLQELQRDASAATSFATDLESIGGSCGAGPFTVFGRLFEGRQTTLVAYDHPFGVGYLAAVTA